ncbi:hypothetical protein MGYG_07882 [Nannizzia gypsea CBS 118893]|uniref:Major facilitator superfamily (MFS) profile domain-containing protein n=1 Tax=Arthroderma gypseum (strain ATCC MYA-4604 / CBS 118893) TaxID=535722 RepID=E4V4F7_ARTGP|nr:hypothetical protein MGYG_07882 [Nannizzia gypsea CBS 118893]EFR04881.1 hypothetical protein MGYG_07882 [Nannizzia gypsea CBS 118893]
MGYFDQPTSQEPLLFALRSSEGFIVLVIAIAMFIVCEIIPIIPKILVLRAGAPKEDGMVLKAIIAQFWTSALLSVYGATLLLGSPLLGYFSDHFKSRRAPFTLGLVALFWIIGLVLIVDNIPQERAGEAMGCTTMGMMAGSLLGPTLGGVSYDLIGYYGGFILPSILIVLDIVLRLAMINRQPARVEDTEQNTHSTSPDYKEQWRITSAVFALLISCSPFSVMLSSILTSIETVSCGQSWRAAPRASWFYNHGKVLLGVLLALIGLGVMTVQIITMTEVFQVVYEYEAQSPGIFGGKPPLAQGYALFNMAYASGQFLGPIIGGALQVKTGWAGITIFFWDSQRIMLNSYRNMEWRAVQ